MFSKSERFRERAPEVPPVGQYDVKLVDGSSGPAFDRSSRFRDASSEISFSSADESLVSTVTPCKSGKASQGKTRLAKSEKKKTVDPQIVDLEKQIKQLLAERNDLNKQLLAARQELTKVEGRLQVAVKEKLAFQAQVASLLKENMALSRGKVVLEAKAMDATGTQQKVVGIEQELRSTSQQLQASRIELTGAMEELASEKEENSLNKSRIADLEKELSEMRQSQEVCNGQLLELEAVCTSREETISSLKDSVSLSEEKCKERETELAIAQETLASNTLQRNHMESKIGEQEKDISQLKELLKSAQQSVAMATKENEEQKIRVVTEMERQAKTRQELEKKLSSTQTTAEETKGKLKRQEAEHLESLNAITEKCLGFERELANVSRAGQEHQAVLKAQIVAMEVASKEVEKEKKKWMQQYHTTSAQLKEKESTNAALSAQVERLKEEYEESEKHLKDNLLQVVGIAEELRSKDASHSSLISHLQEEKKDLNTKLEKSLAQLKEAHEKVTSVEKEKEAEGTVKAKAAEENVTKEISRILVETQKKLSMEEARSLKIKQETSERIQSLEEESDRLRSENAKLQREYSEMEEKFRPFKDQIDGLEDLNKLLLSQTSLAQSEAQKLGEMYSKLVGHQNTRQKIQHVKKLKDENSSLKQEVTRLQSEIGRLRRTLKKSDEEKGGDSSKAAKPLLTKN